MDEPTAPSPAPRKAALPFVVIAVAVLAALIASALLVVDYLRPVSVFCGAGGGCDRLKLTTYAAWAGVPTPLIGLVGFAMIGALALFPGPRARLALVVLSAGSALFAAFLLAIQIKLGIFCRFCIVVDVAAIVLLVGAWLRFKAETDAPRRWASPVFGAAMPLAAAIPLAIGFTRPMPARDAQPTVIPDLVLREIAATPPGQVAVIDFVDFECPFCRMTHAAFVPVLEKHAQRVKVVRKQVPLASIHPGAMPAALAACCGDKLGKREEMAEALFSAPVEELTPKGCEAIAGRLGLDLGAFRACIGDPSTQARVDRDIADFRGSGGRSLPTIWIDGERLTGAQDPESLEEAILRALKRRG